MRYPFGRNLSKIDAVRHIAANSGLHGINPWGAEVDKILMQCLAADEKVDQGSIDFLQAAEIGEHQTIIAEAVSRPLRSPEHLNERPECFPPNGVNNAFSPAFKSLNLKSGVLWNFAESPVVYSPEANAVVQDYSSRYSRLIDCYDVRFPDAINDAVDIPGNAIVFADDIRPLNFCHWLVDWLPRLAAVSSGFNYKNCYILSLPLTSPFQLQSLEMCGFHRADIVEITNFKAYRAQNLIATSDLPYLPHPAFKAAPWAITYLQATVGFRSVIADRTLQESYPKKIYISREDAAGRRIVNEDDLVISLIKAGYVKITLSKLSFVAQVALFAGATHIVGLHGAGLSHLVFVVEEATVIEIFPITYGTPAFYVLAAGLGNYYATYVARNIISHSRTQIDDIQIDVADFCEVCSGLI